MTVVLHALAGFAVAVCCTPAGISGAFLLLPIQIFAFGAPSPTVSATNLLYNTVATPAGVVSYRRHDRLDGPLARMLLSGTLPGMVLGVLVRSTALAHEREFAVVSGTVLAVIGARLLLEAAGWGRAPADDRTGPLHRARLTAVGVVGGLVGGVYGLGGAAIVVPWLVQVERVPVARVSGAGLVTTLVTSIVGLVAFVVAGSIGLGDATAPDWSAGIALGVGGALGAVVGVAVQPRIPVASLKALLGVTAVAAAVRLVL